MDAQLLQLMRLVSPALPVGSFAYSQGLESAIEQSWINNEAETGEWISGVLNNNLAQLDLPALYWQLTQIDALDAESFINYNRSIFAYRETSELRLESHQMGLALMKLLADTYVPEVADSADDKSGAKNQENDASQQAKRAALLQSLIKRKYSKIDWVSAFALAAATVDINPRQALLGFAWAWAETQVAAAIKMVPLGQTQGQRLLLKLVDDIAELIERLFADMPEKDAVGAVAPNLVILSCQHETQYSRLFRS